MSAKAAALLLVGLIWLQLILAAFLFAWGMNFLAVFICVLALAVGIFFVASAYSVLFGAPFVPMDRERVSAMLSLADVKAGDRLVDLGSGDGRVVIAAAKAGARAEGWEVNPYLWLYSAWKIRSLGLQDRARVNLGSYWPVTFDDADVVTLFLITSQMPRMQRKLQTELRPGSRVVSYVFSFPDWQEVDKREGIRLYRKA
jgi:hypothetical protein